MSRKKEMDQLSRDALMATRLGMTYGKYKAMKWERERAVREKQEQLIEEARKKRAEKA